jgi:hypothetical protein
MPGILGLLLTLFLPLAVPLALWSIARRPGMAFAMTAWFAFLACVVLAWQLPSLVTMDGGPKGSWGYTWGVVSAAVAIVGLILWGCRANGRPAGGALTACIALSYPIHFVGLWVS